MILIQVALPHFRAAIVSSKNKIIQADPILAWSVGKTPQDLAAWVLKKKGDIRVIDRWKE